MESSWGCPGLARTLGPLVVIGLPVQAPAVVVGQLAAAALRIAIAAGLHASGFHERLDDDPDG